MENIMTGTLVSVTIFLAATAALSLATQQVLATWQDYSLYFEEMKRMR